MIGEEISGYISKNNLTVEIVEDILCLLPAPLCDALGVIKKGRKLSNHLSVF
ncbi:hypothetical protein [Cytobacillus purgationiresistens]|uniref:Uncharacterized protein n=1 Tax=Cytobacillus purgationiresistens TaxID=863449 RepID=A0ABU0AK18_9BACI|nr:hypothetical protein [Cytobacillus purgationiresistens]MDQ0271614.1 hypothetical protein [Cytobacillus purgationiresistens]